MIPLVNSHKLRLYINLKRACILVVSISNHLVSSVHPHGSVVINKAMRIDKGRY
jgi:hypothetical protein